MPRRLLVLVGSLVCCGCVGFRGGLLPPLDHDEIVRGNRLPAISYELGPARSREPWSRFDNEQLFRDAFVDARRGRAVDDLHIALDFRTEESLPVLGFGSRVLCLFSLGLVPAYSQEDLSLTARVEFKGRLLREYLYEDRITIWAHLLLLPWAYTSHHAFRVRDEVQANMLLHLIRDLRKDLPTIVPVG